MISFYIMHAVLGIYIRQTCTCMYVPDALQGRFHGFHILQEVLGTAHYIRGSSSIVGGSEITN